MKEFDLIINTPKKQLYNGKANVVNMPGAEGLLEVLQGHAPLLCNLAQGEVAVKHTGGEEKFSIISGFAEVNENQVTLLVKQKE